MSLTVNGLKLWLAALKTDGNELIVLAKDAEGNQFAPLSEVTFGVYHPLTACDGEIYEGETVREENDTEAIVLWPTN
jgi:hypothetical protein